MKTLLYATSNPIKFHTAQTICTEAGISLKQVSLDVPEIQAQNGEDVARAKALEAYEKLQQPVIISDDSWMIPGINNFPGPFMKFVDAAFTAEDWLRLTKDLTDRRIILRQIIAYQDAHQQQLFYTDVEALLIKEIRGKGVNSNMSIISLDGGKTSVAEQRQMGKSALAQANQRNSWHDLCDWLLKSNQPLVS